MNTFKVLFILFLAIGCSSSPKKERKIIVPEGEPVWLYSSEEGCRPTELCASGEGSAMKDSDAHAKKALAAIFETKIKANFKFSRQTFDNSEIVEMKEVITDEVNKQIEQVLKGAQIRERFKKDGIHFSLAVLDKNQAIRILRQELTKIDSEMEHYYSLKSRIYIKKLNMLFNRRELLNEKMIVVDSVDIPRKITFSQINNLKFTATGGKKLHLITATEVPRVMQKKIEEIFTEMGYEFTGKEKNASDYVINIKYGEKEEYLNVNGFKKFTFLINIEATTGQGKKLGIIALNEISNGRTKKDAFLKVRGKLIQEIGNNIEKLNLK